MDKNLYDFATREDIRGYLLTKKKKELLEVV